MFALVVKRFHWLSRIPGFPQIFDSILVIGTALFSPGKLRALETFEKKAIASGLETTIHHFGGIGFLLRGQELVHLHGNGLLDALVGTIRREAALKIPKVMPHHVMPSSGWVSFWIESEADLDTAIELTKIARDYRERAVAGSSRC